MLIGMFAVAALAAGCYRIGRAVLARYRKFGGRRLVTCPQTHAAAAVSVDAWHAALSSASGEARLRVSDCSRWPERRDCGQGCLAEIAATPEECLVRTIVEHWYRAKVCVLCRRAILRADGSLRKGALMAPDRKTLEWSEVQPEDLPTMLQSHQPLCWSCHITETFRRLHPELVLERPASGGPTPRATLADADRLPAVTWRGAGAKMPAR